MYAPASGWRRYRENYYVWDWIEAGLTQWEWWKAMAYQTSGLDSKDAQVAALFVQRKTLREPAIQTTIKPISRYCGVCVTHAQGNGLFGLAESFGWIPAGTSRKVKAIEIPPAILRDRFIRLMQVENRLSPEERFRWLVATPSSSEEKALQAIASF